MNSRCGQTPLAVQSVTLQPLVASNDQKPFITPAKGGEPARLNRKRLLKQIPATIVDRETLKTIEVLRLHRAVDYTLSATGSAALLRAMILPSLDFD